MSEKTVALEVIETLRDMGVQHVFGVPSGGWVDYMEALRVVEGIEFILATHEGGAAMMAEVAGRLSGAPGVCFGTFGPGATNLTTGVGEALLDRSPMIALTDEMAEPMRGRTVQMGIDHQALFAPITKKTTRLRADAVRQILNDAGSVALSGRPGPVHVGLPVGMSAQPSGGSCGTSVVLQRQPTASSEAMAAAADLIKVARRPVLAIGLGAVEAKLKDAVKAYSEKFEIPVVLTPMAKGMFEETHPNYVGVLFHALSDVVGETHRDADLIIAIGYDPVEFNFEAWMPSAPLVNIDVVPADIDRAAYPTVVDVVGDIGTSLEELMQVQMQDPLWDFSKIATRRASMFKRMSPSNDNLGPTKVLEVLRAVLPRDGIMACDVGAHTHLIGQMWPTPEPRTQLMTNGWSTMGFGIPAAIAAKLTLPDVPVCAVVGDGGFLMTVGELATAVRYNLPLVIVVLTDNDLALIRIKQQRKDNPIYGTTVRMEGAIGGPDLFGVPVKTIRSEDELRTALEEAFLSGGPRIVEAIISSSEYDSLVLRADKS